MGALDAANWERHAAAKTYPSATTAARDTVDAAKTAEAVSIVGAAEVKRRGGVNKEGYFNDVPTYQQLSAGDRARVTNANGTINTAEMLNILNNQSIAAGYGSIVPVNSGVVSGGPLPSASITATPPAPEPEMFSARMFAAPPPVKTATLDIILFDEESVPTDGMFDQIFENIGGQELISITRSDIVNGQKISYQPIKNLSAIQQRYNPNNILSLQQTADKFFAGFSIKLEDKIPETGNGTNGENVYLNAAGDLIIEFINVNPDEQVETQISVSGTIYEADLGDYAS